MKFDSLGRYQIMVRDFENRVRRDPLPDWKEYNDFAEEVGREFCKLPPDYNMLMNPENETSFLHTFGEAIYAFYAFCLKMTEVVIWPVKLLLRRAQQRRQ